MPPPREQFGRAPLGPLRAPGDPLCIPGAMSSPQASVAYRIGENRDAKGLRPRGNGTNIGTVAPRSQPLMRRCQTPTAGTKSYIRLYLGPLPPSRGVHRGPSTSVALQSTQFGAFTRRPTLTRSYAPA